MYRLPDSFISYLSKKNRRPQKLYREILNEALAGIEEHLSKGKPVPLLGFCTFYTRMRKPAKGKNFKTGETIAVPEVRLASFRPSPLLKQAVRIKARPGTKKRKSGFHLPFTC